MNKKTTSLIAIIILIILAFWALISLNNNSSDDDGDNDTVSTSETTPILEDITEDSAVISQEEPPAETTNTSSLALEPLIGEKPGVASLLLTSLSFPESVMTTTPKQTFTLNAKGFDLTLLGNESLAVEQGVYPKVEVAASGEIMMTSGNVTLKLTSLSPSFYVDSPNGEEADLDQATQEKIITGLAAAGIMIPEVSNENPALIPVEITSDGDGGFKIISTENSPIYALFQTN